MFHYCGERSNNMENEMRTIAVLCAMLFSVVVADKMHDEFKKFKNENNKKYTDADEEKYREHEFAENSKIIEKDNSAHNHRFKEKMNEFGDMSRQEFNKKMNGFRAPPTNATQKKNTRKFFSRRDVSLPDSVDWRKQGYVSGVKHQGNCGSCWAFSAVGALEGLHAKTSGSLVSLSDQQSLDCVNSDSEYGCDGGWMEPCFEYAKNNGGIFSQAAYPYKQEEEQCRSDGGHTKYAQCSGYIEVDRNEEALKAAVAEVGPIAVAVDAGKFQFYSSGVFYDYQSGKWPNHAMLLVGYGKEDNDEYWLLKNSWGTTWGEGGYMKLARNRNNHCGIDTYASFPVA